MSALFTMRKILPFVSLLSALGLSQSVFALPEGFKMVTFAKPPQVTYPTGVAASGNGDVYVSVDLNSSIDQKANRGKIVKCVDTDGDGVADKFTDYVPYIDSPRSSCFVGDTLYVVNPPFLSAFRDKDNDGIADEKVQLVTGMGFDLSFRGADHTSNGVRMGIDGWLYLAIGDYGFVEAKGRDGHTLHLRGGGVIRVRPDGTELENYALYARNIYDVAVSPKLDVFSRDNTNDGKGWNTRLHHFVSLGNHGYPRLYKNFPAEHMPPLADYGGGSGTGGYWLDEPGFPDAFNDALYTCDFTTQHVYVHRLTPHEGTFNVTQDSFYKIKAIDMDADGNSRMYVSDWKNGGYRYSGPDVGSVSLITFPGKTAAKFPDLAKASDADLLRHIVSDSAVCRINTQREILKRSAGGHIDGLARLAADKSIHLHGRIAALFALKQLAGESVNKTIARLTLDETICEWAFRALADRKSQTGGVNPALFVKALRDKNPRVRLQAVIGLARLGQARKSLLKMAAAAVDNSPKNRVYANNEIIPHIARKALVETGATQICLDGINDEPTRQIALAALQEMHTTEAVDGLIQKLQDSENPSLNTEILTALCRLYYIDKRWDGKKWWSTRPDDRGPYFEPVEWEASPRIGAAIKTGFDQLNAKYKPQLVAKMKLNRIDSAALGIDTRIDEALAFIASASLGTIAIEPLRKAALDGDRVAMVRSDAFNALGRITGNEAFNTQLAIISEWQKHSADQKSFAPTVREFIYEPSHLGRPKVLRDAARKQKGAAKVVTYRIALQLEQSPLANDYLRGIMGDIIRRGAKNAELLAAIGDSGSESYRELVATAAKSKDAALSKAALVALDKLNAAPATGDDDKRRIVQLGHNEATALLLQARGDAALGSLLFARQACIACHTTSQDQPQKGPYLGDAGKKWKRADLIQSILKPSAVVSQGFQTQWFELKNGTTLEGFVTGEKDGVVDLRNIAGIVQRVKRSDVAKSGTRTTSMMPEGLAAGLTVKEMASLIDYLESLK